ncbi:MAG: TonB C-terminal domain-containing protein [Pseudomonadota bacterium]
MRNGVTIRVICCAALAAVPALALLPHAQASGGAHDMRQRFDIPSQPLAEALRVYARQAGVTVFFDGELAAGRHSSPVRGDLAPGEALQTLLAGSDLQARYTSHLSFTLTRQDRPSGDLASPHSPAWQTRGYVRRVQASLERALCQSPDTQPGDYRAVVQLWLGEAGDVQRVHFAGSTGWPDRDAAIATSLRSISIEPLPDGIEQPLTLLLLPRSAHSTDVCAASMADAG